MRRCAKEEHLGVGEQGAEINHRTDADEEQQREQLACNARVEQRFDSLRIYERKVYKHRAKAHGKQKRGLHVMLNRKVNQHEADEHHQPLLPREIEHVAKKLAEEFQSAILLKYKIWVRFAEKCGDP